MASWDGIAGQPRRASDMVGPGEMASLAHARLIAEQHRCAHECLLDPRFHRLQHGRSPPDPLHEGAQREVRAEHISEQLAHAAIGHHNWCSRR